MTMRYAHLATNDLDGCVTVLETPRCGGAADTGETSAFSPPLTASSGTASDRSNKAAEAKAARVSGKSSKAKQVHRTLSRRFKTPELDSWVLLFEKCRLGPVQKGGYGDR